MLGLLVGDTTVISVENLTFAYGKAPPAIDGLSFSISPGEIFGFLGPSGAGKSTTQKILMRLLKGYTGDIEIMGRSLDQWKENYFERIGVCFELPSNYRKLTDLENLQLFARFFSGPTIAPTDILGRLGLADVANKRAEHFSQGMQLRLNLALALLNRPDILLLDEPTAGLDPGNARRVRQIIREERDRGTTIFLTTHDMMVANELCDRVGFLVDGRLTSVDSPASLRLLHGRRALRVQFQKDQASLVEELPLDGLSDNARFQDILRNGRIESMHSQEPSLEDVFLSVTGRALE